MLVSLLISLFLHPFGWGKCDQATYPHWDWNNPAVISQLKKIDDFIEQHKHTEAIAVFDWDGTVYDETIRSREAVGRDKIKSGQAIWHVWAANNATRRQYQSLNLFPRYRDCTAPCVFKNLIAKDDYLEELLPKQPPLDPYSKFSQIAVIEAGMTPQDFMKGVKAYEKTYPVKRFAFLPMFDVIQEMINQGFHVWFVSGSNPYFIATLLKKIEQLDPRYDFSSITGKGHFSTEESGRLTNRIIGNHATLYQGRFTRIYDNRYIQRQDVEPLHAIVGPGKALAMQRFIRKHDNRGDIVFAAGNSSGDIEMFQETLKTPNSLVIVVNPAEKLHPFIQRIDPQQLVILDIPEEID